MFPHVNPPGHLAGQHHLTEAALELPGWWATSTAMVAAQLLLSPEDRSAVRAGELEAVSAAVTLQVLRQVGLPGESFGALRALFGLPAMVTFLVASLG